jgi:hypothetical protein
MTEKSPHTVRVNDETWAAFVEWVEDVEGQKHGEIGRHVDNALREYMNADRQARLERNQHEIQEQLSDVRALLSERDGTHTHKAEPGCADSDPVAEIHRRVVNNYKGAVKDDDVERVIENVRDLDIGDPRTLRRYKEKLRQRGLLFEHPGEPPLWTADRDMWTNWATATAASTTDLRVTCEPYPALVHENGQGVQIEFTEDTDD